jgi:hypothetical protein
MMRALNTDELYEAFTKAAGDAVDAGDGEARTQLNLAADMLEPFAMGFLASALLEMGVGK